MPITISGKLCTPGKFIFCLTSCICHGKGDATGWFHKATQAPALKFVTKEKRWKRR
jgi:hypothetical protein